MNLWVLRRKFDRKKLTVLVSSVCMLLLVSCSFAQKKNQIYSVKETIESNSIDAPLLVIDKNTIGVLSGENDTYYPIITIDNSEELVSTDYPVVKDDDIYFSIEDSSRDQIYSVIYKYCRNTQELSFVYESKKCNLRLINVDDSGQFFCIKCRRNNKYKIQWYNDENRKMIKSVKTGLKNIKKSFFLPYKGDVLIADLLTETPKNVFMFYRWNLDTNANPQKIGKGINPKMSEDGTLFVYETEEENEIVLYSTETREKTSFEYSPDHKWGFLNTSIVYLLEDNTSNEEQPKLYFLTYNGKKSSIPNPKGLETSPKFFVGVFKENLLFNFIPKKNQELYCINDSSQWSKPYNLPTGIRITGGNGGTSPLETTVSKYTNTYTNENSEGDSFGMRISSGVTDVSYCIFIEDQPEPFILDPYCDQSDGQKLVSPNFVIPFFFGNGYLQSYSTPTQDDQTNGDLVLQHSFVFDTLHKKHHFVTVNEVSATALLLYSPRAISNNGKYALLKNLITEKENGQDIFIETFAIADLTLEDSLVKLKSTEGDVNKRCFIMWLD